MVSQSPSPLRGALQAPNGQYAGYTYTPGINRSASPVIGAYSPYPTMLYVPAPVDGVAMANDLLRQYMQQSQSFLAMQQARQAAAPVQKRKSVASKPATPPVTGKQYTMNDYPPSTADDYGDPGGTFGIQPSNPPAAKRDTESTLDKPKNMSFYDWEAPRRSQRSSLPAANSEPAPRSDAQQYVANLPFLFKLEYFLNTGRWLDNVVPR